MHTQSLMVCHSEYINWAINVYYLVMVKLFVAHLIFFNFFSFWGGGEEGVLFLFLHLAIEGKRGWQKEKKSLWDRENEVKKKTIWFSCLLAAIPPLFLHGLGSNFSNRFLLLKMTNGMDFAVPKSFSFKIPRQIKLRFWSQARVGHNGATLVQKNQECAVYNLWAINPQSSNDFVF